MMRRLFAVLLLAALALPAWAPVSTPAWANEKLAMTYIPIVDTLPAFVAQDEGFFAKHGLDMTLIPAGNQTVVLASLVSGQAQIGNSIAITILQAREAGIETQIIADSVSYPYAKPLHMGLIVGKNSNIHSAKDLVGRKVAVLGLNGYHQTLVQRWLEEKGVDPKSVKFVEVPFPQMGDVLRAGTVDGVVSIDPFYNRIINSGTGYVFDNFVATVPDGTMIDFFVVTTEWGKAHKDAIVAFRAAMADAIAFIKANDAKAREILGKYTKQPAAVLAETSLPDYKVPINPAGMQFWIDLAKHQGLISHTYDVNSFIWKP